MHDQRIPRATANIDHIVVMPGGVWVIDTKRYAGKAPEKNGEPVIDSAGVTEQIVRRFVGV